jgi:hypothetical protein
MIWIRGNGWGFAMIFVGGVIAGLGSFALKFKDAPVLMSVGAALIVMDVIVRARGRGQPGWLWHRRFGGHLFFIPIWLIGLVVFGVNSITLLSA